MAVSINDVRSAYAEYARAARAIGFGTNGWSLEEGSKPNGLAYRTYDNKRFGTVGSGDWGYLGSTKTEALATLETITRTLWDVVNGKD